MFKFYEVGGAVRDSILGLSSKDIDFVAVPDEVVNYRAVKLDVGDYFEMLYLYLERNGFQVFLATKDCYTIRAKFPKNHVNAGLVADFVLARKEIGYKEGTRTPIVVPGTLEDDLRRRDFTVNAIARDEDGQLYDPFNGLQDIHDKILRTPISGDITFGDDPLRLLRAIRFAITKGFTIDPKIDTMIRWFKYDELFHVVSEERIREELYKCFKADTVKTLSYLYKYSRLMDYVFSRTKLWLKPTNED